jgi:hypothetical protein
VIAAQLMEPQYQSVLAPKMLFRLFLTITATALQLSMVPSRPQLATAVQSQSLLHVPTQHMLTLKIATAKMWRFPQKTQLRHLGNIIALASVGITRPKEFSHSQTRMLVVLTPQQELISAALLLLSLLQSYQFSPAKLLTKNNPVAAPTWLPMSPPEIAHAQEMIMEL